jgi:alpha-tubulin suppressor-like RCC1 family protein
VTKPTQVQGLSGVVQIEIGEFHACGLLDSGRVSCWGSRFWSELGDGKRGYGEDRTSDPVMVSNIETAVAITVGSRHTCALLKDKTVSCWGEGTGEAGSQSAIPLPVLH